ncbi:hypothetical protein PISMIDRAFT_687930 [Pisolithus microcarpus 441]|uniref:Unplaced genomic scaffold scaffold_251, whole genome shotgun sequence n=1 Tax=Pisolithus microcarpus 441 TaxID=765257 RepID=A0A0C9Z3C4_9AGAM|nr:hypothetical protein BKA83DRAFT_687930 [Pisolithus microcarpus]KIK14503.1 hypothetical protein PISMIDRAFT_687930 [Pisolithus microcarpus 441]
MRMQDGNKKCIWCAECVPPLLSKTLLKPWNGLSYQALLALAGTRKFNGTSEVNSQPPSRRQGQSQRQDKQSNPSIPSELVFSSQRKASML